MLIYFLLVANEDHSNADCLLICVSTSGDDDVLNAKDGSYKPEELWAPFTGDKCKTLAGKPKIIIAQASRGDKMDDGALVLNTNNQLYTIPAISDILIMYSTCPGMILNDFQQIRKIVVKLYLL